MDWRISLPRRGRAESDEKLDDIANHRRQWMYSALRTYSALLLADHFEQPSLMSEGVQVNVIEHDPDAFEAFFDVRRA